MRHDDFHLEPNEFLGKWCEKFRLPIRITSLDQKIFTFYPAKLTQRSVRDLNIWRIRLCAISQNADSAYLCAGLRCCGEPRPEKSASQRADKYPAVHYLINDEVISARYAGSTAGSRRNMARPPILVALSR
jgi:hypothetical protein